MHRRCVIICLAFFVLSGLSGCGDQQTKPLDVFFVRDGLAVENLGRKNWELTSGGKLITFGKGVEPGDSVVILPGKRLMIRCSWQPGQKFHFKAGSKTISLTAPQKPSPLIVASIDLKNIKPHGGQMGHAPDTEVRFSPSGQRLAIGTFKGRLIMVEIPSGKRLWERNLAEGMVKRLAFGDLQGRRVVYVGEQSPEGILYCLDVKDGSEVWRFEASRFLGRGTPGADAKTAIYNLPGYYYLRVLPDGDVLAVGTFGRFKGDNYRHDCRIWRLDGANGRVKWSWPKKGNFPYGITWVGASKSARVLAFISFNTFGPRASGPFQDGTIYCLNSARGQELWHYKVPPLEPYYDRVGSWQGVSVSPDGSRILLGLNDGRVMLFNVRGGDKGPVWTRPVGAPVMVGDLPVAAPLSYARLGSQEAFLATPGTSICAGAKAGRRTPQPHPHARHLFAYGLDGALKWQHRTNGAAQGIILSHNGRWAAMCVGASNASDDRDHFGLTLFDIDKGREGDPVVYHFATQGPAFFQADISRDGDYLALTESPYTRDEGKTVHGTYRVLVIH